MFSHWQKRSQTHIGTMSDYLKWRDRTGTRTRAGVAVDVDKSLQHSAVWSSVNFISTTMAMLPVHMMRHTSMGPERVVTDSVARLVKREPNVSMGKFRMTLTLMAQALLLGNGHAWIKRDPRTLKPASIYPLMPRSARGKTDDDGNVVYVTHGRKVPQRIPALDVIHYAGFGYDGVNGLGAIEQHMKETIGLGLAAQQFGSAFFGDGANSNVAFQHPGELGDEAYERLRSSIDERFGGIHSAMRPMLLEGGMEVSQLSIPPEQAQFLETRKYNRIEIAGMFGLPPIFIGEFERATWNNAEQMDVFLAKYLLSQWTTRIEEEYDRKLLTRKQQDDGYFFKFNLNAILRGDTKTRALFYKIMRETGAITGNEIRLLEDMMKLEGLDDPLLPLNMAPATSAVFQEDPEEPAGSTEED